MIESEKSNRKVLAKNTIASTVSQVTALACGFILPGLFLHYFGSEVNGLVNSIAQFLSIISFLELGVGTVVQSSLYKPLAEKNNAEVSKVVSSADRFFHRLARIMVVYVVILAVAYPFFINHSFGFLYTASLIGAMSISSFAQFYFGIVNSLLLNADQRGYIQYNAQTITVILNTCACVGMIVCGGSVQLVKLITSLLYLARPLALRIYVSRKYKIDWKIQYSGEPITQKWNGVAQHIAAVVLDGTDTIVLSLFASLSAVSIYSVYYLVVNGVRTLTYSLMNGVLPYIGNLWAKGEKEKLAKTFGWVEWAVHTITTYVFGCTAILLVPFVQVYTNGIQDANYYQPQLAFLLTLACAVRCLRLPYNFMVLAAGHYRQTQSNYVIAAIINIVTSIATVKIMGLVGVAIGTLLAMLYQTIWLANYNAKALIDWPLRKVLKRLLIDMLIGCTMVLLSKMIAYSCANYLEWFIYAIKIALMGAVVVIGMNMLLCHQKMKELYQKLQSKVMLK